MGGLIAKGMSVGSRLAVQKERRLCNEMDLNVSSASDAGLGNASPPSS